MAGRRGRLALPATRDVLVMGQLALSLVTLTAAGCSCASAVESAAADPGFTFERGIVANVDPSLAGRDQTTRSGSTNRRSRSLRAMPGVAVGELWLARCRSASSPSPNEVQRAGAPLRARGRRHDESWAFGASGERRSDRGPRGLVSRRVGADYFKTIGLDVTRGREFTAAEEFRPPDARASRSSTRRSRRSCSARENPLDQIVQFSTARRSARSDGARASSASSHRAGTSCSSTACGRTSTRRTAQDFRSAMYLHVRHERRRQRRRGGGHAAGVRASLRARSALPILSLETRPMYRDRNIVLWMLRRRREHVPGVRRARAVHVGRSASTASSRTSWRDGRAKSASAWRSAPRRERRPHGPARRRHAHGRGPGRWARALGRRRRRDSSIALRRRQLRCAGGLRRRADPGRSRAVRELAAGAAGDAHRGDNGDASLTDFSTRRARIPKSRSPARIASCEG